MNQHDRPTLKERLSRLENELNQLIAIQEKTHSQSLIHPPAAGRQRPQKCPCVISRSHMTAWINTRLTTENALPFTEIAKFLQNINLNLNKGAQAISKIANATSLPGQENGKPPMFHKPSLQHDQNKVDFPYLWNAHGSNSLNENALFKELREEKDKRLRSENQIKILKDELKKSKCEIQHKAEATISLLHAELREITEKWNNDKSELEKIHKEHQACEYLWPLKYETLSRELEEERSKRVKAERNMQRLDDLLQKRHVNTEEHLSLKGTIKWLKEQNKNLTHLSNKLQYEIEENILELQRRDRIAEDSLSKIKQLTCICQKLRDQLIIMRDKIAAGEEKLRKNFSHSQRLVEKLLEEQSLTDSLRKLQTQDKQEISRLNELINELNSSHSDLQSRVDEITTIMKQQNSLVAQQSETINMKDEQLKLAYENIKLKDERFQELTNKETKHVKNPEPIIGDELNKYKLDLQKEMEINLIQKKIIEDHLQTISQYKIEQVRKDNEINHLKREASERTQKLAIEQTTNEQLLSKIKVLINQKEELMIKVEELEEQLESHPLATEHTKRLEQIEIQVREKQKEWEDQKMRLVLEKEEALESLRCVAQKLADKTDEWQKEEFTRQQQIESFNKQLREKEEHLQAAFEKNVNLERELDEVREAAITAKNKFAEKLENACKAWQNTLLILKN